jgi:hypothetical protein
MSGPSSLSKRKDSTLIFGSLTAHLALRGARKDALRQINKPYRLPAIGIRPTDRELPATVIGGTFLGFDEDANGKGCLTSGAVVDSASKSGARWAQRLRHLLVPTSSTRNIAGFVVRNAAGREGETHEGVGVQRARTK